MDQKSDDQKTGKPREYWVRFEVSAEVADLVGWLLADVLGTSEPANKRRHEDGPEE